MQRKKKNSHSKLYYSLCDLFLLAARAKQMISSLAEKSEMEVNRQLLSKHWGSLSITQIKYTAGGKWSSNLEAKKKEGHEGKYKWKRLVNIIMCVSCNHLFKCRYQRGELTDGRPRWAQETQGPGAGRELV